MAIKLTFEEDAREHINEGVEKSDRVLQSTIGPLGRSVVMDKGWGAPEILDDGDSVADDIELLDPFENAGAQMIREAAKKTSKEAGDGTTTSALLAGSLFQEGFERVSAGVDPMALRRGLQKGTRQIRDILKDQRSEMSSDNIEELATLAAKQDETIGSLIARAYDEVGEEGAFSVEEGNQTESTLRIVTGMQFDRGYLSPQFVTDEETGEAHLKRPYILVFEGDISSAQDLVPLLEKVAQEDRPLLVIAGDVEGEALATMTVNKDRGTLQCAAIKAPGYGERRTQMLEDIAIQTGAEPIFDDLNMTPGDVSIAQLGQAEKVKLDADSTTITGGAGSDEEIDRRAEQIQREIEETDSSYDREKLQERRARLKTGLAEIRVGAATETELKEKKSRAKDALNAVEAALEEGVVPGGGVGLLNAADQVEAGDEFHGDEHVAVDLLKDALRKPLKQIARNAGYDPDLVVRRVRNNGPSYGLDVVRGEYGNLEEFSILDPYKVLVTAVDNAASVAGLLFTTECVVSEFTDEEEEDQEEMTDEETAEEAGYL